MTRVTLIEQDGKVLYTLDSDYEVCDVSRVCSFTTSPVALYEIQTRVKRKVRSGSLTKNIGPLHPNTWLDDESYDHLKRILSGHKLPIEGCFLTQRMREKHGAKIPLVTAYHVYTLFCKQNAHPPLPLKKFGKLLRDVYNVETKQTTFRGRNITCILNYEFNT